MAFCGQAQPLSVLQLELSVRLQLDFQVADRVRYRHSVVEVGQWGAEAQVQALDSHCGCHRALA